MTLLPKGTARSLARRRGAFGALGSRTSGTLRERAGAARADRIWWLDAHYRRELCLLPGSGHGDWLQYGHALKELGRYRDAERAYVRALKLQPNDAETTLQMAHLMKLAGRIADAGSWLDRATELGHEDREQIRRETRLIDAARVPAGRTGAPTADDGLVVFLSAAVALFDEQAASGLAGLGGRDYSYAFAMRNFIAALDEYGFRYDVIANPEYVADIAALTNSRRTVHIGFYPPEQMRLLKGAYNIDCFAWEFERLRSPSEQASYHAFADQATMLRLPDELWVPSSEAARMIGGAIGGTVRHLPAPVVVDERRKPRSQAPSWRDLDRAGDAIKRIAWQPLAILPRLQGLMNQMARNRQCSLRAILSSQAAPEPPRLFLTVLNVHDFRKQLRPLLEGFQQFCAADPNAYLLIKMTTPDRGKLTINEFIAMDQVSDPARLIPPMVSERIWITDDFLTGQELKALYDASAFYVCTSYAEGQNLPLLEAMSHGAVPVSVDVTAMADYIDEEDAIVIPSKIAPADVRMTDRYRLMGIDLAQVSPVDVDRALTRAMALTDEDYASRSAAARRVVTQDFSPRRVADELARVGDILDARQRAAAQ